MFQSDILNNHLKTSDTIKLSTKTFIEWNMNDPDNIKKLGNYRHRPSNSLSPYYLIPATYIENEPGPTYYYTGATESDTVIESGLNNENEPTLFVSRQEKMKMLFSLEDCIKPFRPRSGINKLLYLGDNSGSTNSSQYIDDGRSSSARRPRYYMASKDDQFKYWTSFRKELGTPTPPPGFVVPQVVTEVIRGVSFNDQQTGRNYIEDACPFVVYEKTVPTNKIVVKMQTNVGEIGFGTVRYDDQNIQDPLYGDENKTVPKMWKIEILKNNVWQTVISFDENSTREDGSQIIKEDGYVEISYGLEIPKQYSRIFNFISELSSTSLLPSTTNLGNSYLIKGSESDIGTIYIYDGSDSISGLPGWNSFVPRYSWSLSSEEILQNTNVVKKFVDPDYFIQNNEKKYREFEFIDGIRIVVETMNKPNCTFDLIEFSPRLFGDISELVQSYSIAKILSDLGNYSIPVGDVFAATGNIQIFDTEFAFNENNPFDFANSKGSIISNYLDKIIKFIFYKKIPDVDSDNYYLPVKTMYSFGMPQTIAPGSILDIQLRDMFFFLENSKAPQLLLTNVSLSYAIIILLDYIGFDNYVFKRSSVGYETIIPYFFVEPSQNVAEVLKKLAVASQSAMFFDEYNNFVVMSKEYLLPESEEERKTDSALLGDETAYDQDGNSYPIIGYVYEEEFPDEEINGCFIRIPENFIYIYSQSNGNWINIGQAANIEKPNIVSFSSKEKRVYNSGQINYTTRYLQRSIGTTSAAMNIDEYKNYIYKPVLLWEAPGNQNRQTINQLGGQMGGYVLGAVPLNTNLTEDLPYSLNNTIYNNIIDVGENVYWMTNYQGYFYANGEIIRYDAIEYIVTGLSSPVWITSNLEYQEYFGQLKFNGKMYPTGRIRIYTDPEFEEIDGKIRIKDSNPIKINGRGQFGTTTTSHSAGLVEDNYWLNNNYVRGCFQEASAYLFNSSQYVDYPSPLTNADAGKEKGVTEANFLSQKSVRSGIIKNFLTDKSFTENDFAYKKTTQPGTIQSSALTFLGPDVPSEIPTSNFVSYIYKEFFDENGNAIPYKHYGTRMRIIGDIETGTNKSQTPLKSFPIYAGDSSGNSPSGITTAPDQQETLRGGSGGLAFNIDKNKNTGYYFETVALSASNIDDFNNGNTPNVVNYNILASPAPKASGNSVTVHTDKEISYQVGQNVIIAGLSVSQFNGEFTITSISSNKKQFTYKINTTSSSSSTTGGTASAYTVNNSNIANIFFYKVMSSDKGAKIMSYQRTSNILTMTLNNNSFKVGETIVISGPEAIQGLWTIRTSSGKVVTIENPGPNTSLVNLSYSGNAANNIYLFVPQAIPYKLWSGLSQINVDSGEFYGQGRLIAEQNSTVYDLSAEYINEGDKRRFFLYINNKQVATVIDENPLAEKNSLALFVRGTSKCMFENVYAMSNNYSQNSIAPVVSDVPVIFDDSEINATESLRKYALSGIVQQTYLSGISSLEPPKYNIYYEEFGTILREAAYFNILYDRAYPAIYAKLAKTFNNIKGYVASGFYASPYGADFLVFNCTDFAITLDDTSGNYLRILGITFTQDTTYTITVEDLYKKKSNLLDVALGKTSTVSASLAIDKEYNRIRNSIDRYGKNEITIESPYIQSSDAAENVFSWIINKVSRPRRMIGVSTFGTDNLQLGDIVKIKYFNDNGVDIIVDDDTRFVIYQIEEVFADNGPKTTMFLAEV